MENVQQGISHWSHSNFIVKPSLNWCVHWVDIFILSNGRIMLEQWGIIKRILSLTRLLSRSKLQTPAVQICNLGEFGICSSSDSLSSNDIIWNWSAPEKKKTSYIIPVSLWELFSHRTDTSHMWFCTASGLLFQRKRSGASCLNCDWRNGGVRVDEKNNDKIRETQQIKIDQDLLCTAGETITK